MDKKITFIVRAIGDSKKIYSCLSSIRDQSDNRYNVIVLYDSDVNYGKLSSEFSNYEFIAIDGDEDFSANVNSIIKYLDTDYFMLVDGDEIIVPNVASFVIDSGADIVVFNVSKKKKIKFAPVYSTVKEMTLCTYISAGVMPYNNAVKTDVARRTGIDFSTASYCSRALFLIRCYSLADSVLLTNNVFIYKETVNNKGGISYPVFKRNRKVIKAVLKDFASKSMNDERETVVKEFVAPQIAAAHNEKNLLKKLYKKFLISKYMWI